MKWNLTDLSFSLDISKLSRRSKISCPFCNSIKISAKKNESMLYFFSKICDKDVL